MKKLEVGDKVKFTGGYDYYPLFLKDHPDKERIGKVIKFIPGQNEEKAAVVKLDVPITVEGVTGDIFILELRYVGQTWHTDGPVHIELCNFMPEDKTWKERKRGMWVESHASFTVMEGK